MRPFLRCALCPSRGRGIGASGARSQRRRPKTLGSNCKCDLHLASRDDGSSYVRAFFTARDDAMLCSTCFSCSAALLSLRADLRESLADERESKWSVGRRRVPSRNQLRRKEEPSRVFADQLTEASLIGTSKHLIWISIRISSVHHDGALEVVVLRGH